MFSSFRTNGLIVFSRVLIKPVLERSLRSMLALANERLASSATEDVESPDLVSLPPSTGFLYP
jgi:hypothetical protein